MKHPYPVRVVLPSAALLLGAAVVALSTVERMYSSQRRLENEARQDLEALGSRTAAQFEDQLSRADMAALERDTALLSSEPQLRLALVLDEHDHVLTSTLDGLRDRTLAATPASVHARAIREIREHKAALVEHSGDAQTTWGAFAFAMPRAPGELRPTRTGVLYLEYDLANRQQQNRVRAWAEAWTMSAFVLAFVCAAWLYFDWTLTRRVARLVLATRAPDETFFAQPLLSGSDELAQLSEAFRRMAATLQERNALLQAAHDELEQRVAERTHALHLKNKELETFSYSVSHDLKAPLRGIDGYSRLLLEDYASVLDAQGQMFLRNVRNAVAQMTQLIDDLLAYSRMERRALALMPIELSGLVRSLLNERAQDWHDVELQVELCDAAVLADPDGLSMTLRNLLDNAYKFSAFRKPPKITLRASARDGKCLLSVQDNGTGFDMRFHDKIFVMFQRLHRAEDYPGTGIGLAIVHKAVERMQGRVWADSSEGCGATFYVELPCAASPSLALKPDHFATRTASP